MSFTKLTALAEANGVSTGQAWMLPVIIDGLQIVATVATVALPRKRWYPWALLLAGAVFSVGGNVAYAEAVLPGNPIAKAIAALPTLVLLVVTHLTVMLAREPFKQAADSPAALEIPPAVAAVAA
ncbi:DUF2637 domain-containing protein [Nocardia terpenica]|nr:DUF2637 domain-containing protein [Nocardia terpenica]